MTQVRCICFYCKKQFNRNLNKYNQSIKLGKKFYCSHSCAISDSKKGIIFKCQNPSCDKISYRKKSQVLKNSSGHFFCSSSCAAIVNNKNRVSKLFLIKKFTLLLKKRVKTLYLENPFHCCICKNSIPFRRRQYKTCSTLCGKKNKGGYNPGSGFSKHGWYKGYWCDSTYELIFLIYCLDHNIPIKRNTEKFFYQYKNKMHYYLPDFIIYNTTFIEIKGFYTNIVDIKQKSVVGKSLKILYKKDLQVEFNYVMNTYQVYESIFDTLFDNYKPNYEYTCNFCNKIFYSHIKKQTSIVFCSRVCSGKSLQRSKLYYTNTI